jgi:16S rRNA (guanine527-N7)-methyltransferase
MSQKEKGTEILCKYFPKITTTQREQFEKLGPLYEEWNSKINVISRKDMENLYLHHILHSLSISMLINQIGNNGSPIQISFSKETKIFDVGTGGGFPGIPLAIMYPDTHFTLCDSTGKKLKVAEAVAKSVGLKNVAVLHARAEEVNESFDYVVSRAVTDLQNFLPWIKGKYDKSLLYLKGGDITDNDEFLKRGALLQEIDVALKRNGLTRRNLKIFNLNDWFSEDFFNEKRVLQLTKRE